jgi:hypothetical protein
MNQMGQSGNGSIDLMDTTSATTDNTSQDAHQDSLQDNL